MCVFLKDIHLLQVFTSRELLIIFSYSYTPLEMLAFRWTCHYEKKEKEMVMMPAAAAKSLQSCLTLCNPIGGSPPGSAIPGILQARTLEWVAISFSNLSFSNLNLSQNESFPMSQLFASGGQSIGVSTSTSVLPVNTQDWSLGWTLWISLLSKELSRFFSNTTASKHQLKKKSLFCTSVSLFLFCI